MLRPFEKLLLEATDSDLQLKLPSYNRTEEESGTKLDGLTRFINYNHFEISVNPWNYFMSRGTQSTTNYLSFI